MRTPHHACRAGAGAVLFMLCASSAAQTGEEADQSLPDPLTLEQALAMADASTPRLRQAQARLNAAQADLAAADALDSPRVRLGGRVRWVGPPDVSRDAGQDDHALGVAIDKSLYDSGRSRALREAAGAEIDGRHWRYKEAVYRQRLLIMERYFDVLLADLRFAHENEAMAVAFVTLDRLRAGNELGQIADLELLESESEYQTIRRRRFEAQSRQRTTRARLARALNRPKDLPANLAEPHLPQIDREIPTYERLVAEAEERNPVLKALRSRVAAAQQRVEAARAGRGPVINAQVEATQYTRELGSYDDWRAGISLEVPLYTGGALESAVSKAQSELFEMMAELDEERRALRQQVLELWLRLDTLRVQQDEMAALRDYRELYLDRSRAVYELEVKTDLGDAMVRLTEAQLAAARTRFDIALTWARLEALMGKTPSAELTGPSPDARGEEGAAE